VAAAGYTWETLVLLMLSIPATQIIESLVALLAFVPLTVCTGYLAAWFSNLHNFRQRSVVDRIFWSVPLSIAVSTIVLVLISRFTSVTAAAFLLPVCGAVWVGVLVREWLQLRREGRPWVIGWRPHGTAALVWACMWIVIALLSQVDFVSHHRLFTSVTMLDLGSRVNWTGSILRTGVPPANPLYWFHHAAHLRQYYFWYVDCAVIARMWHLPVRAVLMGGCVWSGFALAALLGLFLKHFLAAGERLRRQFLVCVSLLGVTGLDILAVTGCAILLHRPFPLDLEWWSTGQIASWIDSLLWVPHHIAGLFCCMLAFLLAWMEDGTGKTRRVAPVLLIGSALASAFGLSIYVTFAFFLLMLLWAVWQLAAERSPRPVAYLAIGGLLALVLLVPYLWELTHDASDIQGGSLFAIGIREMIPPDQLLVSHMFRRMAGHHPMAARNLANLILLLPGYALELGFYLVVLLIFLVPAWRGRRALNAGQRSLLVLALGALPMITLVRSVAIHNNDFGWRSALFLQFPLLLLASELLTDWNSRGGRGKKPVTSTASRFTTPQWLRSLAYIALVIGVASTVSQVLSLRFALVQQERAAGALHVPDADRRSHTAYISLIGYGQLKPLIARDAIVQFNPEHPSDLFTVIDLLSVQHQTAIADDQNGCGSELGGDRRGCPVMAAALDRVFNRATAEQARATCREFGIQYLVAKVYDPAWDDREGWVWTLAPVVSDKDFRALDCR
jgi:hypothetical protein